MTATVYTITNDGLDTINQLNFNFTIPENCTLSADFSTIKVGEPSNFSGATYSISDLNILPTNSVTFSVNYLLGSGPIDSTFPGSINVTGFSNVGSDINEVTTSATTKYSWAQLYNRANVSDAIGFTGAIMDNQNNVIAFGFLIWDDSYLVVTKFSENGNMLWQKYVGDGSSLNELYALSGAVDADDNIYILVNSGYGVYAGPGGILLTKFDSNGTLLLQKLISQDYGSRASYASMLSVDDGIIISSGADAVYGSSNVVTKLDFYGNILWSKAASNFNINTSFSARALVKNPNNGSEFFSCAGKLLQKYSSSGVLIWSKDVNSDYTGSGAPYPTQGMAATVSENIYCTRKIDSESRILLLKFDFSGNLIWVKSLNIKEIYYMQAVGNQLYIFGKSYYTSNVAIVCKMNTETDTFIYTKKFTTPQSNINNGLYGSYGNSFGFVGQEYMTIAGYTGSLNGVVFKVREDLDIYTNTLNITGQTGWAITSDTVPVFVDDVTSHFTVITSTASVYEPDNYIATLNYPYWEANNTTQGGIFSSDGLIYTYPAPSPPGPVPPPAPVTPTWPPTPFWPLTVTLTALTINNTSGYPGPTAGSQVGSTVGDTVTFPSVACPVAPYGTITATGDIAQIYVSDPTWWNSYSPSTPPLNNSNTYIAKVFNYNSGGIYWNKSTLAEPRVWTGTGLEYLYPAAAGPNTSTTINGGTVQGPNLTYNNYVPYGGWTGAIWPNPGTIPVINGSFTSEQPCGSEILLSESWYYTGGYTITYIPIDEWWNNVWPTITLNYGDPASQTKMYDYKTTLYPYDPPGYNSMTVALAGKFKIIP